MSGHSKWAQIKRQKGAADQKRGTLFTKLAHRVTLAARAGGGDPDMNPQLRLAMEKAREANMPKDNVERAIKRGTGELEGVQIEEVLYEGFGPEGAALLVEAVTDSKNRTSADMRNTFADYGGSLGGSNSVQWMFEKKGVIRIAAESSKNQEETELMLIEAGADDIKTEAEGITVYTKSEDFQEMKNALEKQNIHALSAELEFVPKETLTISDPATRQKCQDLLQALEDLEDTVAVHTNF